MGIAKECHGLSDRFAGSGAARFTIGAAVLSGIFWRAEGKLMSIRPSKAEDIPALQAVLEGTMLLLSELPPQMIGGSGQREIWINAEAGGRAGGRVLLCGCRNARRWYLEHARNRRAARRAGPGPGPGRRPLRASGGRLRAQRQRVVAVDTAGTDDFAATRDFYGKIGCVEEARIRDFWAKGDDKVISSKSLAQSLTSPVSHVRAKPRCARRRPMLPSP